jgi:hypothetical protein
LGDVEGKFCALLSVPGEREINPLEGTCDGDFEGGEKVEGVGVVVNTRNVGDIEEKKDVGDTRFVGDATYDGAVVCTTAEGENEGGERFGVGEETGGGRKVTVGEKDGEEVGWGEGGLVIGIEGDSVGDIERGVGDSDGDTDVKREGE